jgi:hypothetical protein
MKEVFSYFYCIFIILPVHHSLHVTFFMLTATEEFNACGPVTCRYVVASQVVLSSAHCGSMGLLMPQLCSHSLLQPRFPNCLELKHVINNRPRIAQMPSSKRNPAAHSYTVLLQATPKRGRPNNNRMTCVRSQTTKYNNSVGNVQFSRTHVCKIGQVGMLIVSTLR